MAAAGGNPTETQSVNNDSGGEQPWVLLVVDDERDVHDVTRLALRHFEFKERPLRLLSATSAKDARTALAENPDIAVLLLDVVMESRDAGLRLAEYIRDELHNRRVRIILRTGQPGEAPEESVMSAYDINDYKSKTELTRQKLVTSITSALRSYTDIQEIERRRRELVELEAAQEARNAFVANMSHELRTPLGVILGFTRLMRRDEGLNPQHKENLKLIQLNGEQLLNLINEVLEISRADSGVVQLEEKSLNLHELARTLSDMFRIPAGERKLSLKVDIDANIPEFVVGDGRKLNQVLVNLLGNAIKFTKTGGLALEIRRTDGGDGPDMQIRFAVSDTGPGIAERDRLRIFEPFVRGAETPTTSEGTGLGLAISHDYVHLMGGELAVDSEVGKGSTFHFALKMRAARPDEIEAPAPAGVVTGLRKGGQPVRALIVEDHPERRALLAAILKETGFEFRDTADGHEALEAYKQNRPDVVFMDTGLPGFTGHELVKTMRSIDADDPQEGRRPVILAMVAEAFAEERDHMMQAGCDAWINKPVEEAELFAALQKELGVEFEYRQEEAGADSALTLPDLSRTPAKWKRALVNAAGQADELKIRELADEIEGSDAALATTLRHLMDRYDFKSILNSES